jgi:phosphoglycolate phosphatase
MSYSAVLFDLDGTLLDTLADIATSANRVLASFGFPQHPPDDYRDYIGEGMSIMYARALPADVAGDADLIQRCAAQHREEYSTGWNVQTRPFDGIPKLLAALADRGIRTAVLSNKPDRFTQLCIDEYFPPGCFEMVLGHRDEFPLKPDPASALHVAAAMNIAPGEVLFLGDTKVDMQTARNAEMYAVGAAWGYRSRDEMLAAGAQAIIDRPGQLIDLLNQDPEAD